MALKVVYGEFVIVCDSGKEPMRHIEYGGECEKNCHNKSASKQVERKNN